MVNSNYSYSSNWFNDAINDAVSKGLISFSPVWIDKAIEKKAKNLTIELVHSKKILNIDKKDRMIIQKERLN